ncbi:family 43 glycosylhydrolase [Lutibacter citreus]|uniref:family 43 glycosylhydrolase n=1 Tax=Lutibacter citreus TaxID=2138210 RepID=UPI000DBE4929|nr:family 43 glycosylhydrolase [Lutibacter citreus]
MKTVKILIVLLTALLLSCKENTLKKESKHTAILNLNVFPEKGLVDAHSIIKDGRLYVFCGHDESWDTEDTWRMNRWEIWSTDNLINWKKENEILPTDTYIGDKPNCWAGDIIERDGKYYWYFSNKNKDTGVMVADSPKGPFVDALGKPLLPEGIIGKLHPYDPEIYEENGVYTIFFGAGYYFAATLNNNMISLAEKPKSIIVLDENGKDMWTADKPCIFKRNDIYYLIWEKKYAMSKNLRGPYTFKGASLKEGHCNVFEWEGQYYALLENKDISLFYRGISIKPLYFNEDGTLNIPRDDTSYPANGRKWDFDISEMGWHSVEGSNLIWNKNKSIKGEILGNTTIESSRWLLTDLKKHDTLVLRLKNKSAATKAMVSLASYTSKGAFWKNNKPLNWEKAVNIEIEITANDINFKEYLINLEEYPELEVQLERLRITPALGVKEGSWEIDKISIE